MPRSTLASAIAELPAATAALLGADGGTGVWRRIASSLSGRLALVLCGAVVFLGVAGPWLAPLDPYLITGPPLEPPSLRHWMGTDALGRDLFSGVLHGARVSLLIAGAVGTLALLLGAAIGITSGYRGGRMDDALMRLTEFFQVIPRFFLAIVAIALFGPGPDRLVLVLGVTSWPVLARIVRAEVLSLRSREFVRAAEAMGASPGRIMRKELLPNVLPSAFVITGLLIGQTLLLEASLGFIGLGDPNAMSWGSLAGQAQRFLRVAWWLPVFPGIAITAAVLGLNLLGDSASSAMGARR